MKQSNGAGTHPLASLEDRANQLIHWKIKFSTNDTRHYSEFSNFKLPFCKNRSPSCSSLLLVSTAPITTSEWPFINFVSEWMDRSAPRSNGRWKTGVINVLSTQMVMSGRFMARMRRTVCSRSQRRSVGFVGVSSQTILVSFLIAAIMLSTFEMSTKSTVLPSRLAFHLNCLPVPP